MEQRGSVLAVWFISRRGESEADVCLLTVASVFTGLTAWPFISLPLPFLLSFEGLWVCASAFSIPCFEDTQRDWIGWLLEKLFIFLRCTNRITCGNTISFASVFASFRAVQIHSFPCSDIAVLIGELLIISAVKSLT